MDLDCEEIFLINENIYFKRRKSNQKTKIDNKALISHFEENTTNFIIFRPDRATIKILEKMIVNSEKSLNFVSNEFRRHFSNNLLRYSTNTSTTMSELFKDTFIFIKKYIKLDKNEVETNIIRKVNKRSNINSVFLDFSSFDEIKNVRIELKNKYMI